MTINLKPFNVQKALAGEQVATRGGAKVLQIAYFPDAPVSQQIVALVQSETSKSVVLLYITGKMYEGIQSDLDLFMFLVEKEYWMASGKGENKPFSGETLCTRLVETEKEIRRLVLGTGLIPETIQFHKITRLE